MADDNVDGKPRGPLAAELKALRERVDALERERVSPAPFGTTEDEDAAYRRFVRDSAISYLTNDPRGSLLKYMGQRIPEAWKQVKALLAAGAPKEMPAPLRALPPEASHDAPSVPVLTETAAGT